MCVLASGAAWWTRPTLADHAGALQGFFLALAAGPPPAWAQDAGDAAAFARQCELTARALGDAPNRGMVLLYRDWLLCSSARHLGNAPATPAPVPVRVWTIGAFGWVWVLRLD